MSPFVGKRKKADYDDEDDEDKELEVFDEPFFRDKVTFLFYESYLSLSVLIKGVRVERTCSVETGYNEVSFCVTFESLKKAVLLNSCSELSFVEDRFFGFVVYDGGFNKELFCIRAYSVRTQPRIHPRAFDTLYPKLIALEHDTLIDALDVFVKYCDGDSSRLYETVICFFIDDYECTAVSTNGTVLRLKKYSTGSDGSHLITIPGLYAKRIYDVVLSWKEYTHQQIGYNDSYVQLYDFNRRNGYGETIEFPLCQVSLPDLKSIVDNPSIVHKASLALDDLRMVFRVIESMDSRNPFVVMHFIKDHVNIHYEDRSWDKRVFQFIDANDCDEDFVLKFNYLYFEKIVNEIDSAYVNLYFDDSNRIHFAREDEDLGGDDLMILSSARMDDSDWDLVARGDESLSSNVTYIEKYLNVSNPKVDESQMAEAISRMEQIGVYDAIIEEFKETGIPQIYEPPYGASYSLDEEDDCVLWESIERLRGQGMLVWGVIRCQMPYNRQPITVDCMLYVSKDKSDWPSERNDLFNGYPHVFTCCKEIPTLRDQGSIHIYMSEGGTPLRYM